MCCLDTTWGESKSIVLFLFCVYVKCCASNKKMHLVCTVHVNHHTLTASLSPFACLFFDYVSVIAGALPQLKTAFDLTPKQEEMVVSILYLGGGLGAAVGGTLCDFLGRKPAILWTDIGFIVGAFILFTAANVASVCVGRVVVGFAVAVSGIADVSYLHEIAPNEWRGAIVSVNEACISLGFLLAFVVGTALGAEGDNNNNDNQHPRGWRYMFGIGGVLALVQFLGMWTMPESPIWLKEQGRHEESLQTLRRIHGRDEFPEENCDGSDHIVSEGSEDRDTENIASDHSALNQRQKYRKSPVRKPDNHDAAIQSNVSYESLDSNPAPVRASSSGQLDHVESSDLGGFGKLRHQSRVLLFNCQLGWKHLKEVMTKYRRQVWIAIFMSVTQQFCGQTSVLNYAPSILRAVVQQDNQGNDDPDGDDQVSGWATLSIGLVKFIATVIVIWKIEFLGRRWLLLVGMGTIAFGLLLIAVAFSANSPYLESRNNNPDGVSLQSGSGFVFAMPGVLLVVSGYSMSFGPLTWLVTSELFPADIRGRALGASTIVTYLCASLVTYSFLTAQAIMGTSVVFLIYMVITVFGTIFAFMAIPDTGGKSLDEIDMDLSTMSWWRRFDTGEPKLRNRQSSSSSPHGQDGISSPGRLLDGTEGELT